MTLLSFLLILFTGIVLVTGMDFPFQYGQLYVGFRNNKQHNYNIISFRDDNKFLYKKNQYGFLYGTWTWDSDLRDLTLRYELFQKSQKWRVDKYLDCHGYIIVKRTSDDNPDHRRELLAININRFKVYNPNEASSSNMNHDYNHVIQWHRNHAHPPSEIYAPSSSNQEYDVATQWYGNNLYPDSNIEAVVTQDSYRPPEISPLASSSQGYNQETQWFSNNVYPDTNIETLDSYQPPEISPLGSSSQGYNHETQWYRNNVYPDTNIETLDSYQPPEISPLGSSSQGYNHETPWDTDFMSFDDNLPELLDSFRD